MSSVNINFIRSTLVMLAIGALILLSIVASSVWLVSQNSVYSEQVAQMRRVRSGSGDLLSALQDAETGQRGYLLSAEDSFLQPYEAALARLPERIAFLDRNVRGLPTFEARVPELQRLITEKTAELKRTVDLTSAGRVAEARDVVRDGSGRQTMDQIRAILRSFLEVTDSTLSVSVRQQLDSANSLKWVTIGGAVAIVIVLIGATLVIAQHVRDLSRIREEVELLNHGLEERVTERTEDLIRANQEIQKFAYIVTHDLRAPLVNIMGFTSELTTTLKAINAYVLADDKAPSEDVIRDARLAAKEDLPEAIDFIRSSTKKMDSLINAILKISRDGRRTLVPERIDLKSMLEATAASVHHQITDAGGTVDIAAAIPSVTTDRFSLEQIFGNLFDNAVKYRSLDRPLELSVRALRENRNSVRIEVKDNGRGIAPEDRERVFELFRRAGHQNQPGEGIGLAHVRSLVRNLGGDITVESAIGAGSTFIVKLPSDLAKIVRS
jgi:signal transduction histidine kinase